ncbi:TetR/AcrR family transcriptional regulator [Gordonia sp. HY285]|uniref:TetR/AcrR family transcriptional regulator n=1 Tax=Gordonia liuliyuniae TaxID=2911517 RepID=A0ABS9IPA2_9ACTN|nr:TetR/AcrR family transcriptional regulator [Gordonia liuliyuniae]MCF8587394.1 TetR/AcrR family transcriptional regulator [Gordonia liuliyuniae]MCF8608781.1 TetR/AcrR family transcriptional regulator [Gordonia liuliyuniae]
MSFESAAAPANSRSDARSNHARILAAATRVLGRDGHSSTLSSIAEEAGVGIGTLYRHFPNRGRLVEAVYRSRVQDLCDAADDALADEPSARVALRTWMGRFAAMLVDNRDVPEALKPALATGSEFREETGGLLIAAVQSLLDAGRVRREFRVDVAPVDILRTVTGLAYVSQHLDDVEKPLDVFLDGLRPITP